MNTTKKVILTCLLGLIVLVPAYAGVTKDQNVKQSSHKLYHDLFSVSFPTPLEGWACGRWGTVLHTADGGRTWARQDSGVDCQLNAIMFADQNNGWAVGDVGIIIHSEDGGKSWKTQTSPSRKILLGVYFVTSKKGWAVGKESTILFTENGGLTWQEQTIGVPWTLHGVSFYDENNGWAAGEYGFIYHTQDGGATWQKQAGEFGFNPDQFLVVADNYLFNITAITAEKAVAVGIDGTMKGTEDGGATWEKINTDLPLIHLFGVTCSQERLFLAARSNIYEGPIIGGSFKPVELIPPVPYGYIYNITPRGDDGFAAVGKEGRIYLSDKTGSTWNRVNY